MFQTGQNLGLMKDRDDSRSAGTQRAVALQELRAALEEAERKIDRLMVIRRRQLAAARSHRAAK